jgi:hypothetical protein
MLISEQWPFVSAEMCVDMAAGLTGTCLKNKNEQDERD